MVTAKDDLLMTVLRCGTLDLEMLESVRYDFGEIIGQLDGLPLQEAGFNGLMLASSTFRRRWKKNWPNSTDTRMRA